MFLSLGDNDNVRLVERIKTQESLGVWGLFNEEKVVHKAVSSLKMLKTINQNKLIKYNILLPCHLQAMIYYLVEENHNCNNNLNGVSFGGLCLLLITFKCIYFDDCNSS